MENRTIAIMAAILAVISSFFLLSGCSALLPPAPMVEQQGDAQSTSGQPAQSAQPQPAPQPVPAEAAPAAGETSAAQTQNETVEPELNISGSLKLQDNLELCPHLASTVSCDRYDLRGCDINNMATNSFKPDVLNCRDGQASKREDTQHKFCLIQDCEPLTKDSIVYGYGGSTAYAEYSYVKESVSGGIMLHYTLMRCGEQKMEFGDVNKCRYYRTSSGLFD